MSEACPRPDKAHHRNEHNANMQMLNLWLKIETVAEREKLNVYPCRCGGGYCVGNKPEKVLQS